MADDSIPRRLTPVLLLILSICSRASIGDVSNSTSDSGSSLNSMLGSPEVACSQDGVAFTMETEKPFHGQLYVRDEYHNPKCRINFKGIHRPGATFSLSFNECGMRRQRSVNPRGMMYSMTMMVQFHDIFVTSGDRAYQIRCFYSEQQTNLTNSLDVSPLTTQLMEATFPTPTCTYSIRAKATDGPFASVVKVGDPILHVFTCNFAVDMYRILIKDCYVDDGKNQRQRIIGEDGCSADETIMQTPQYRPDKLEAFGESTAFKWPDESVVYFSCQIVLCMNEGHACEDVTPPKCDKASRSRRSPRIPAGDRHMEFDLEVKKLTVVENDSLRANSASSASPARQRVQPRHLKNTNSTLFEDYVAYVHRNSTRSARNTTKAMPRTTTIPSTVSPGQPEPDQPELEPDDERIQAKLDNNNHRRLPQACFGFETVAAFCVLFTLFVAVLTMITCKLCLPCCSDGGRPLPSSRDSSVGEKSKERGEIDQYSPPKKPRGFFSRWFRRGQCADGAADRDAEDCGAYPNPVYAPISSLSAKQLLFSKLNLEIRCD